jgi:hypothetical protein
MIPNGCYERVCLVISVLLVSRSSPGPTALRPGSQRLERSHKSLGKIHALESKPPQTPDFGPNSHESPPDDETNRISGGTVATMLSWRNQAKQ